MGAGSTKGIHHIESSDEGDKLSVASKEDFQQNKVSHTIEKKSPENNNVKSNVRRKIEMVSDESDIDDDGPNSSKSTYNDSKQADDKKRGLFGFSRKKEEKTNAIIHEQKDDKSSKKNVGPFRIFNFKKESNVENKDETVDEDLKELQTTFDSLGIKENTANELDTSTDPQRGSSKRNQTSQSADDIRNLEPMRNRMNQRRRFSRPANAVIPNTNQFTVPRRNPDGQPHSGKKRNFRYSWEKENTPLPPSSQDEEWDYESVAVKDFDIDKFINANSQVPYLNQPEPSKLTRSSVNSDRQLHSQKDLILNYDSSEQRLLAMIERDFL